MDADSDRHSQPSRLPRSRFFASGRSYSTSPREQRNPEAANVSYLRAKHLEELNRQEERILRSLSTEPESIRVQQKRAKTHNHLHLPALSKLSPYSSKSKKHYLAPTNSSRVRETKKKGEELKKVEAKRICSVNCGKGHLHQSPKKIKQRPFQSQLPVLRQYLAREAQSNYPKTQLNRYLSRMRLKKDDEANQKFVYQTFFGIQPQFYRLKTQYAKQILEQQQSQSKQSSSKVVMKIPHIPSQSDLSQFIQSYRPISVEIDMQRLLRSPRFLIEYSDNELYFGEMIGSMKDGVGILIQKEKLFQGMFRQHIKIKGLEVNASGIYRGFFINGKRQGYGQFQWFNGESYIGEWNRGFRQGKGVWTGRQGDSYNGEWVMGKGEGFGIYIMNGNQYKGHFVDFKKDGQGRENFINGDVFEGTFRNGFPQGKGRYVWDSGTKFQGIFMGGFRTGKGLLKTQDGFSYNGDFDQQKPEGMCQILMPNGDRYYGIFREGKKNGKGTLYLKDSGKYLDGYWQNDVFIEHQSM